MHRPESTLVHHQSGLADRSLGGTGCDDGTKDGETSQAGSPKQHGSGVKRSIFKRTSVVAVQVDCLSKACSTRSFCECEGGMEQVYSKREGAEFSDPHSARRE